MCWAGLVWIGLVWTEWTGLDWTGLDWTGLDWTELDWTGWNGLDCVLSGMELIGLRLCGGLKQVA